MGRPLSKPKIGAGDFVGQVGAEIRRRRIEKYATAEEAAAAAGVPTPTWYHWEAGKIALSKLPLAAKALGCSPRLLLPK